MNSIEKTIAWKKFVENIKNNPPAVIRSILIALIGLFITLLHLYATSWWGYFSEHVPKVLHVTCLSGLTFLIHRSTKGQRPWAELIDWMLFIVVVASGLYTLISWQAIVMSGGYYTRMDSIVGMLLTLCILEATRRGVSPFLALTAAVFIAYALWGHFLPGIFAHRKYDIFRIFAFLTVTPDAIFGIPIGVSANYVILFIIFGAMLSAVGGTGFFMDLAFALTGGLRGGPAKAAVLSSALVGTISGASTANVVTTGTFTIPTMIRAKFDRNFAGAVEAVASTGGQIAPPVMGAAAFIIAEMTSKPYITVAKSAVIPAFLYFFATYVFVDLEAKRLGMKRHKAIDMPRLLNVMKQRGYLIFPLFALFGFLLYGYSLQRSVFLSLIVLILLSFLGKLTRPQLLTIPKALIQAAKNAIPIACACASAGIIMGVITLTGIGIKLSVLITNFAETNLFLGLLLTMLACIVLGCGMPTTAAYVIVAVLAAPSLIKVGISPLAAHMFIFYYGCTAPMTPPVAMSSYAAAAIAEGSPMRVALISVRIGFVVFIVPYLLVYFPQLMMMGSIFKIMTCLLTAMSGIIFLSAGMTGILIHATLLWERFLCFIIGILLFLPGLKTDIPGFALGAAVIIFHLFYHRRIAPVRLEHEGIAWEARSE